MKNSCKGQRLSFWNKYLALFSLLLFAGFAKGQTQTITYTPMTAAGYQWKYSKSDSGLNVPNRDTSTGRGTRRGGSLVFDSTTRTFYGWDGIRWFPFGSGGGGGTFIGIDSVTYLNYNICQWKAGVSTCYPVIPGVDSVVVTGNQMCQWKAGVATCYTINGNVLGVFVDSVVVLGNQLCQWISGVSTCYTINNTSSGLDSITVTQDRDSIRICGWAQGVATCFKLRKDTVDVLDDLYTKIDPITGHQQIGHYHADGLVSGGIVTKNDCWKIDYSPIVYYLNYRKFVIPAGTLDVDTADATFDRIDIVVADSFGIVSVLAGVPSATPVAPQINPGSQVALTTIYIPAGALCLGISSQVIYDGIADDPGQWNISTFNPMTVDFVDTNNPYHLNQAAFFSKYTSQSYFQFTKPSGTDTVSNGEVLKFYLYLNGVNLQNFYVEFYLGTQTVGQITALYPYFNPLDTNQYQNVSVPLSAINFYSPVFDRIRFIYSSNDTSGVQGLYIDWVQLQKGLLPQSKIYVDSTGIVAGYLTDYYNGVPVTRQAVGGGVPTLQQVFNTEVGGSVLTKSDSIQAGTRTLSIFGTSQARLNLISSTTGTGMNISTQTGQGLSVSTQGGRGAVINVIGTGNGATVTTSGTTTQFPVEILGNFLDSTSIKPVIRLYRGISTGVDVELGSGASIDFAMAGAAGAIQPASIISSSWSTISPNYNSQLGFWNMKTSSRRRNMAITEDGGIVLDQYVPGSNDGGVAADSVLVVTSAGIVKKRDAATFGGGGTGTVTNIATGYGLSGGPITTTGTIIVDSATLSTKYLRIVDTANIRFRPIAGSNITLTGTYPNITIAGSAAGITRNVSSTSTSASAGSTALTDYVIYASGATTTITLPTAVGNTNRYTIMRTGTSTVAIATTSSQTINGAASPLNLTVQYASVDLISDGSNWFIH